MNVQGSANLGYTPGMYGHFMPPQGGPSMVAADGTLSLAGVAQAVTRNLQDQAQQISQMQQQGAAADGSGQAAGGGGGGGAQGNGQTAGGSGSASMLAMQAKVGEYTTSLQQGTSIMSGLSDTHKSVAQNTK